MRFIILSISFLFLCFSANSQTEKVKLYVNNDSLTIVEQNKKIEALEKQIVSITKEERLANLEGRYDALIKLFGGFVTIILLIIGYLNYRQKEQVELSVQSEFNKNYETYLSSIKRLYDEAKSLTEQLRERHTTICELDNTKKELENIIENATNLKNKL